MVLENGYVALVRLFWIFLKYMAVYVLWILVWAWEWLRERVYVLGEEERMKKWRVWTEKLFGREWTNGITQC